MNIWNAVYSYIIEFIQVDAAKLVKHGAGEEMVQIKKLFIYLFQ